jgi:hypothetical protein
VVGYIAVFAFGLVGQSHNRLHLENRPLVCKALKPSVTSLISPYLGSIQSIGSLAAALT